MTNLGGETAATIMQMTGSRDLGEATDKFAGMLKGFGGYGETAGNILEGIKNTASSAIKSKAPGMSVLSSMAAGCRIDFPMVWKSSGFVPSYTMTVRLYNPNPADPKSTKKYIAGPLAAIMLLGIPLSKDGAAYSWPFIHRISSPGIYDLDPAFISNITVIKGGDQQQIAYNQRMGIVDVRIDFGSLYSSMLAAKGLSRTRPTLEKYLDGIAGVDSYKKGVKNFSTTTTKERERQLTEAQQRGAVRATGFTSDIERGRQLTEAEQRAAVRATKNQAPTKTELPSEEKQNPADRVVQQAKDAANNLISRFPTDFKINIPTF